jgi:hypothetical protein
VLWVFRKARVCWAKRHITTSAPRAGISSTRIDSTSEIDATARGGTIGTIRGARTRLRVLARCVRGRSGGLGRDEKSRQLVRGDILQNFRREH